MTCMYPTQNLMFNPLDLRSALVPLDHNTSGFPAATGGNFYYYGGVGGGGGGGGGSGTCEVNVFHNPSSSAFDLDLKTDEFNSPSGGRLSIDSSPSSQSSSGSVGSGSASRCGAKSGRGDGKCGREDKICGVCGDKALGFNFDAISCESCKAFFRRNAPKGLSYFKCPYDEKCKMDMTNRRFCKRCRLKKCLEVGMRKEYILTEEEKATKKRKIEENRFLKKLSTNQSNKIANNEKMSSIAAESSELMEMEWQGHLIPTTPLPHHPHLNHHQQQQQQQQQLKVPLLLEDSATIRDLHIAYRNSLEVNMEKVVSPKDGDNLTSLVNIAELSVRRVIAMVKQVTSFKNLPQVEQIHLLKGGSIELLIIRSVITFDEEKQHFLDPLDHEETSAMRIDQLERAEDGTGLFEDHMKFVRSLATELRADETTLILLLIISLFSPDRENLTWKELVSEEQEKYSRLLQSYLESVHPPNSARILFAKLLMKLTDIRNLNEEHSQVLLKVKPEGIHPLMKEVLDLAC